MKIKQYRIKARDPKGYYSYDSIYQGGGGAPYYFGPFKIERAQVFYSMYEAKRKLSELKIRLPYFEDYGFTIEEFEEEIEPSEFTGFIFLEGEVVYIPYFLHASWVDKLYGMDQDHFMLKYNVCKITHSETEGTSSIILPYNCYTKVTYGLTEAQAKAILDMDLPLDSVSKLILRDSLAESH